MADAFGRLQSLILQLQGALGGMRHDVRGLVSSAGAASPAKGFTVSKTGTGTYVITYTTAFSTEPIPQLTIAQGGALQAEVSAHSTTGCTVTTFNTASGANADSAFFISVDG